MGRALRERAGMRVRQPLRALHVRAPDERSLRLLRGPFASAQVLEELNIKGWGSLATDDQELCKLVAKPNFKLLGKRLGARMKAAAAAIGGLAAADLARLRAGEPIEIALDGEPVALGPDEVEIQVQSQADFDVEADGRFVVWLDTELDEELVLEGLTRELCSRINGLRKERGLQVEDRIRLQLDAGDDALLGRALERHRDLIAAETLATAIELGRAQGAAEQVELGDGHVLSVALERARA
jgi:isoleucyl-tRNA synthetase